MDTLHKLRRISDNKVLSIVHRWNPCPHWAHKLLPTDRAQRTIVLHGDEFWLLRWKRNPVPGTQVFLHLFDGHGADL